MMYNNLFINRLRIITEEGKIAYNEIFHKGVNIIRGDNSSCKSTITHFIFFVLGGAYKDFVPEAKQCSEVMAEVKMNGAIFTIKRELIKDENDIINAQAPMYFYWGNINESLSPPEVKMWLKYNDNTTSNRKSFSNVIFDNLKLPQVKGDSNITIHQILRLLYIDQESPTSSLFYYEHFDSQFTRETVSDLLLGIYNEELYENKKRLISVTKELGDIRSEIRVTKRFFSNYLLLKPEYINNQINAKETEINKVEEEIIALREADKEEEYDDKSRLEFQKKNELAIKQRSLVTNLKKEIENIKYEIQDSEHFIDVLKRKITALKNSIHTRDFLGNLTLEYCPECLSKINNNNDADKCKLCKTSIDNSFGTVKARRMEQEIHFQILESEKLQVGNNRLLLEKISTYEAELVKLRQIQRQVNASLNDVKSYREENLDQLYEKKGFIDGEILQWRNMLEKAELYQKLEDEKKQLEGEVKYLNAFIYNTEKLNAKIKMEINKKIKEEGIYLLNNDLHRQDEFKNANDFFIDYSNNIAFLSNKYSKYSASSNFYLKIAARFAIFLTSLSVEQMRFPRFIFADNMEDKGIEIARAQNFQKILIERVNKYDKNNFQIIYTTSYITDELNNSSLVVGEYYTNENPSLKNIAK